MCLTVKKFRPTDGKLRPRVCLTRAVSTVVHRRGMETHSASGPRNGEKVRQQPRRARAVGHGTSWRTFLHLPEKPKHSVEIWVSHGAGSGSKTAPFTENTRLRTRGLLSQKWVGHTKCHTETDCRQQKPGECYHTHTHTIAGYSRMPFRIQAGRAVAELPDAQAHPGAPAEDVVEVCVRAPDSDPEAGSSGSSEDERLMIACWCTPLKIREVCWNFVPWTCCRKVVFVRRGGRGGGEGKRRGGGRGALREGVREAGGGGEGTGGEKREGKTGRMLLQTVTESHPNIAMVGAGHLLAVKMWATTTFFKRARVRTETGKHLPCSHCDRRSPRGLSVCPTRQKKSLGQQRHKW